jgi:shikimate kinase
VESRAASGCIALLGFRGAGKSTLGVLLAASLRRPFFDLDVEIALAQGRTLAAIFRDDGEAGFRQIEAETFEGVVVRPGIVLAPGGGIVEREANRRLLRARCRSVYLDVAAPLLVARLSASGRPPLTDLPLEDEVTSLLARRDPLYRECATHVLPIASNEAVETTFSRLRELLAKS